MFTVIYSFKVKEGMRNEFLNAWNGLTLLIYKFENSLGSRLHQSKPYEYIAYACWPDKATWKKSGDKLPDSAQGIREKMRASCHEIQTLFELNLADDLLKNKPFNHSQ